MAIIRRPALSFDDQFTQVPNAWLRDERLSYRARGILAMVLSHRAGWAVNTADMTTDREGRDAVRSAVSELERAGYLVRERLHGDGGRIAGMAWILQEPPCE